MSATLRRVFLNGIKWRMVTLLKQEVYRKKKDD